MGSVARCCRNVLIHQKPEKKTEIVRRLREQLVPGGYLDLGAEESLLGISNDFEIFNDGACVYYRAKGAAQKMAEPIRNAFARAHVFSITKCKFFKKNLIFPLHSLLRCSS